MRTSKFSETQIVSILKEAELFQYRRMYAELARENDAMNDHVCEPWGPGL